MGGAARLGNITPAAEFNILTDPHAAAIVFGSGAHLTMFVSHARPAAVRPCVIAWLLTPYLFTGARHRVDVELEGRYCQGRTVVDADNLTGQPPNVTVINDLDNRAFLELLETRLGRT